MLRIFAFLLAMSVSYAHAQVTNGTTPLTGQKGGTGNAFMQFTGPASSLKTYTLPNAISTLAALATIQTWTGAQSFTDGTLVLLGSSSGSVTLHAPASGGVSATFFSGTDTVAGLAASQALTNKTFNCANNNCTVRIASDVTGLGTGVATALGNTLNAASGLVGFSGALGTPTSGTLTNTTGLPVSTGLSGAGTGVLTALGVSTNTSGGIVTPTPTRAGDIIYWNGSAWVTLPGNNSGTLTLQENASGVPVWASVTGTGTVTSITPGGGIVSSTTASCSQSAVTTSGTLSSAECFDARSTTTETINDSDRAKVLTFTNASATAASIAQAGAASNFQAGWYADIRNTGAGTVTITPTTSTINGQSSLALVQGASGRLTSDGANYQLLISTTPNTLQASPGAPTGTTSATPGVMMGLGSTCKITPALTGRIMVSVQGQASNTTSTGQNNIVLRTGTGVAPSNGVAATGTAVGATTGGWSPAASGTVSFHNSGIVTGLAVGTQVWIDVALFSSGATSTSISGVSCNGFEF